MAGRSKIPKIGGATSARLAYVVLKFILVSLSVSSANTFHTHAHIKFISLVYCQCSRKVLADSGVDPRQVLGVSLDTTCCSVVALDALGHALRPCLLWWVATIFIHMNYTSHCAFIMASPFYFPSALIFAHECTNALIAYTYPQTLMYTCLQDGHSLCRAMYFYFIHRQRRPCFTSELWRRGTLVR